MCHVVLSGFKLIGRNGSENEKIIVILVLCVNMDKPKRHSNDGGFFSHGCTISHLPAASMVRAGSEYLLFPGCLFRISLQNIIDSKGFILYAVQCSAYITMEL